MSKLCSICNSRPRASYPSKRSFSYCVECNRDVMREAQAQRAAYINKIKMDSGCEICGYNAHPAALTFDHIDPSIKSFDIGSSKRVSQRRLDEEIAKCRVICANCHNIHTHDPEFHHVQI